MMRFFAALLGAAFLAQTGLASDATPFLKAGAAALDITPEKFPISVNGGFADRQATKASDPLHARALVVDNGKHKIALVVVDSCMLPRELIDEAKALASNRTGIPTKNMLVSATHTHTAPTSTGVFQSEPNAAYVKFLTGRIADAIEQAHKNLAPAEIGYGSANEPGNLFNRRWKMKPGSIAADPFGNTTDLVKMNPGHQNPNLVEPAGPIDPQVSVLFARNAFGKPLAAFASYGLHYVGDRPALSADYFGVYSNQLGAALNAEVKDPKKPRFVGALFNGTSGDVNNVDFKNMPMKLEPGERSRLVAESVMAATKKALADTKFVGDAVFASAEAELELAVRKPNEAELKRAKDILQAAGDRVLTKAEEVYARETVLLDKYPATVKLRLQAHRIGDLIITAIPCEVFAEIGLQLKKNAGANPSFTISLANGYNGYLPTPAQHKLGGYETWRARSSYLEVDASDKIIKVLDGLRKEVLTAR
jgi:hypothetical protein